MAKAVSLLKVTDHFARTDTCVAFEDEVELRAAGPEGPVKVVVAASRRGAKEYVGRVVRVEGSGLMLAKGDEVRFGLDEVVTIRPMGAER